jgi:hypothetical protein
MKQLNRRLISILLFILLLGIGNTASADCDPNDGNNTAADAAPLSLTQPVTGTVCPDDPFDFYTFTISQGGDFSGQVSFSSLQASTVLRLFNEQTNEKIIDDLSTNDTTKQYSINISPGELSPGTYIIRIFFWSAAAYDHDYTLTASLDGEEPGEGGVSLGLYEGPELQVFISPHAVSKSPWSSKDANALNIGRSRLSGPTGTFTKTDFWIIDPSFNDADPSFWYRDLRVGQGNRLFYAYGIEAMTGTSAPAQDTTSVTMGSQYQIAPEIAIHPDYSGKAGICLDYSGKLYLIEYHGGPSTYEASLVCFDNSMSKELWRKSLPDSWSERRLLGAGEYVYTYHSRIDDTHIIQVRDSNGDLMRSINVSSEPVAIAEDAQYRKVYIQDGERLHKYNYEGEKEWGALVFEKPVPFPLTPHVKFGPTVGYDSKVWVSDAYTEQWVVFDREGSRYKEWNRHPNPQQMQPGFKDRDDERIAMALSTDGKLVTAIGGNMYGTVICMNDWDQELWKTEFDITNILDMVMDSKNRIYLCISEFDKTEQKFFCYLVVLNIADGSVTYKIPVTGFTGGSGRIRVVSAELAIGEDNSLIMLQQAGCVAIFSSETHLGISKPPVAVIEQ